MRETISGFFQGPRGEGSSKRIAGLALLSSGIVYVFVGSPPDNAVLISLLTAGTALLGVAAITKT